MGYLVSKGIGGTISYSGTEYINPNKGTHKLCLRTGLNSVDVVKYGLTSNSSASEYCGMKMRIDGNIAYIGRSEVIGGEKNAFVDQEEVDEIGEYIYGSYTTYATYRNSSRSSIYSYTTTKVQTTKQIVESVSNNSSIFESKVSSIFGQYTYRQQTSFETVNYSITYSYASTYLMQKSIFATDDENEYNKFLSKIVSSSMISSNYPLTTTSWKYGYTFPTNSYTKSNSTIVINSFLQNKEISGINTMLSISQNLNKYSYYSTISLKGSYSYQSSYHKVNYGDELYSITIKDAVELIVDNFNL